MGLDTVHALALIITFWKQSDKSATQSEGTQKRQLNGFRYKIRF